MSPLSTTWLACSVVPTSFDRPLNSWVVSSVTDMSNMFRSAHSFNQTLNSWDVLKVTDMSNMFRAPNHSTDPSTLGTSRR